MRKKLLPLHYAARTSIGLSQVPSRSQLDLISNRKASSHETTSMQDREDPGETGG